MVSAIEVPDLDEVGVDHRDLLEPGTREAFEELISPVRAASLLNQSLASVERQISGPGIQ